MVPHHRLIVSSHLWKDHLNQQTRRASLRSLSDSNSLDNSSTLISCISQSTPIAKATAIPRLTCPKLYTAEEVLEQVINGSDIELDDYSNQEINAPCDNKEDY